jgi:hypothetical protein
LSDINFVKIVLRYLKLKKIFRLKKTPGWQLEVSVCRSNRRDKFHDVWFPEEVDAEEDDLLFENPNHASGAWKPNRQRWNESKDDEGDETDGTDETGDSEGGENTEESS